MLTGHFVLMNLNAFMIGSFIRDVHQMFFF